MINYVTFIAKKYYSKYPQKLSGRSCSSLFSIMYKIIKKKKKVQIHMLHVVVEPEK